MSEIDDILDDLYVSTHGGKIPIAIKGSDDEPDVLDYKHAKQKLNNWAKEEMLKLLPTRPSNELIQMALQNGKPQQAASYNGFAAAIEETRTKINQRFGDK